MKQNNLVQWDDYGIKNNPSKEAVSKELLRLNKIQNNIDNISQNNISTMKRARKIKDLLVRLSELQ